VTPGVTVVKVGGNEVDDRAWTRELAGAVAESRGPVVLVHGGGKEVTELQRTLGAEPEWRDGLRVTTPEALRAVSMVLSGVVNKRLVAALVGAGADALGISGEDGALLRAEFAQGGRLGRTGEIVSVRTPLLTALLEAGLVPVLSPVSRGPDGGALNVNADDAAAAVAAALGAERFLLVSNVPGVLGADGLLAEVAAGAVESLIESGVASGGMAPKLRAAARAAGGGVGEVRIGGLQMLRDPGAGTRITPGPRPVLAV
jgi:acetylglutamate kinase